MICGEYLVRHIVQSATILFHLDISYGRCGEFSRGERAHCVREHKQKNSALYVHTHRIFL